MQKVFSYAPMARSMGPMLSEEGYHIGSGRSFLRELVVAATDGSGRWSIKEIQKAINVWVPRALEMFGNERGGETAVAFGFKDRNNGTAQNQYLQEAREVLELTNVAIVQCKVKDLSAPDARTLVREIQNTGESQQAVRLEDLLSLPDIKFFRARGMEDIIFLPYDVTGTLLTENGKPIPGERYLQYLQTVLPDYYMQTDSFGKYRAALLGRERPDNSQTYGW
jgi:hypothetical protein